jgi:hypothetical protein
MTEKRKSKLVLPGPDGKIHLTGPNLSLIYVGITPDGKQVLVKVPLPTGGNFIFAMTPRNAESVGAEIIKTSFKITGKVPPGPGGL